MFLEESTTGNCFAMSVFNIKYIFFVNRGYPRRVSRVSVHYGQKLYKGWLTESCRQFSSVGLPREFPSLGVGLARHFPVCASCWRILVCVFSLVCFTPVLAWEFTQIGEGRGFWGDVFLFVHVYFLINPRRAIV